MKIKNKFLDVTLDDLTLGDAKPFDVSGTSVAGKKIFTAMPKTSGVTENMNDAATWAYLQTRKENVKGDAELLVLPILQKDIDAKGIIFEYPVASCLYGSVMVQILHGPELARDMDFTLMANGAGISWDGYALDGRIEVGDVLVVAYKKGAMWVNEPAVYVADEWNHSIQKFDLSGNFIRKFDLSFNSGTLQPKDVSLDGFGNIYVTVTADNCIYKYDHEGNFLFRIGYDVLYGYILGVAIDNSGNIYASYYYDDRILKFDSSGNLLFELGGEGVGDGELSRPYGIAVDGSGNLYVAEGWNNRIQKFDPSGNFMMKFGTYGNGEGEFKFPSDVAIDNSGNIYVTDRDNRRVQKFDPSGNFLLDWGAYCDNWEDEFGAPQGIAVDHLGDVYVTDKKNNNVHNVQKYDSNGTLLLKWGSRGHEDGQFYDPLGIACFPRPF